MARPKKEGLDYFPHDVHASNDEKIEPLLLLYGAKGYAFFFLHLEYIYRNRDLCFDVSDAETRQILCNKLKITIQEYDSILKTALKKGCFDQKEFDKTGKLTSDGIKKRAKVVTDKRERSSKNAIKSQEIAVSGAETNQETPQEVHKGKERKVKESKGNIKEEKTIVGQDDPTPPKPENPFPQKKREEVPYAEIVSHLNEKCGSAYRPETQSTRRYIKARWNEGHRVEDFRSVIDSRHEQWAGDAEMLQFLRPETLFGAKFDGYLQFSRMTIVGNTPGKRKGPCYQCSNSHMPACRTASEEQRAQCNHFQEAKAA